MNQVIKRSKTKFFVLLLLFGWVKITSGQTTDRLQYYIIYDVSGSIGHIDIHNNLQTALNHFINLHQNKNKDAISVNFTLIPFGENANSFIHSIEEGGDKILMDDLIKRTEKSTSEIHSNLTKALEKLDSLLQSNTDEKVSTGAFIFTDGFFGLGDFADEDNSTLPQQRGINTGLIVGIQQKLNDRLYLVQTSPNDPIFDFISPTSEDRIRPITIPLKQTDSINYAVNRHYFWINSKQKIESDSVSLKAFGDFIQDVNADIIRRGYAEVQIENPQEAALVMQEVFLMENILGKNNTASFRNQLIDENKGTLSDAGIKVLKEAIAKKDALTKRMQKDEWSCEDIIAIQCSLEHLSTKSFEPEDKAVIKGKVLDYYLTQLREDVQQKETTTKNNPDKNTFSELVLGFTPVRETIDLKETTQQSKNWGDFQKDLIEGTADYMIKRAKMEVAYAFLDNINDLFKNQNNTMLIRLFPVTFNYAQKSSNQYDMAGLKDAVKKDIDVLPENIANNPNLIRNDVLYPLWAFLKLYENLMKTGSIKESFSKLYAMVEKEQACPTKESADSTKTGSTKNSSNEPNEIVENEQTRQIRILIDSMKTSKVGKSIIFSIRLINFLDKNDFAAVYQNGDPDKIQELSKMLLALAIETTDLKQVVNISEAAKNVVKVYENYSMVIAQVKKLKELSNLNPTSDFDGYRKYQKDILIDILRRTGTLLTTGSDLIKYIIEEKDENPSDFNTSDLEGTKKMKEYILEINKTMQATTKGINAWFNIKEGDYVQGMYNLAEGILPTTKGKYNKNLSTFIAASGEIAAADTPEEVSAAIARHTLPVASHKIKKSSKASFMLGSYLGISYAHYIKENRVSSRDGIPVLAVIGPEYSWATRKRRASFSVMGTLVDLGNIVQYKLHNKDSDQAPATDATFARIFSPGLLVSASPCYKLPLALTMSYMGNPGRFQAGLAIDMPLLGIWKKME